MAQRKSKFDIIRGKTYSISTSSPDECMSLYMFLSSRGCLCSTDFSDGVLTFHIPVR